MYINFWYPIGRADEINGEEPFRAKVLGMQLVAFRDDEGTAHVLSDTCVHRGGSLSKGWVKNNCVVCPYHGWEFGGSGKCQTIPSVGVEAKPPARAKVDSYPVQEKYGIVFAFLGDLPEEERMPIYDIVEFEQDGWRANPLHVFEVNYYFERSMENGLDPAHNEFVHPTHGFSGKKPDYRVADFEVKDLDQGHGCWFMLGMDSSEYKDENMKKVRDGAGTTKAGSGNYGPNTLVTHIHLTDTNWFHQYFFEAPIDETSTRIFFINMRNCMMDEKMDAAFHERNMVVAKQDIEVLTELDPVRTPLSNSKEILMPSDRAVAAYRDWKSLWDSKGWKIDQQALREKKGDVAFAIPSPDRRDSGNWVLDSIPLVPSSEKQKAAAE